MNVIAGAGAPYFFYVFDNTIYNKTFWKGKEVTKFRANDMEIVAVSRIEEGVVESDLLRSGKDNLEAVQTRRKVLNRHPVVFCFVFVFV